MSDDKKRILEFTPAGDVLAAFLNDNSFVRGIMGPLGSGKSSTCAIELPRRAKEQKPSPDGIRHTRFAVIRNSYPELKTTTIRTYFQWMPQEFGKFTQDSPIIHHVKAGDLDMEVLFLALDREEDQKKLLSLELTGAWINEAREINKGILDALTGRVGRYPSKNMGGCTWSGIIMDTNPPDDQSWWYKAAEEETPEGWKFFRQPAGDGPLAENLDNLPKDGQGNSVYYQRIKAGKDEDWVKVYVKGEYGFVNEGKSVYPNFRDAVHVAPTALEPVPKIPLILGADFGLTPAGLIAQKLPDGRWLVLDEVITEDCGVIRFAEALKAYVNIQYPDHDVSIGFGDPAGNQRSSTDERTALEIMNSVTGWKWRPAPSNEFLVRKEVVTNALNRMVDGRPGLLVSPKCKTIRKGFSGGYHYKYVKTGNGTQLHETPAKNSYSHPHDALQYLLLGGGEHHVITGRAAKRTERERIRAKHEKKPLDNDYDIFNYSSEES